MASWPDWYQPRPQVGSSGQTSTAVLAFLASSSLGVSSGLSSGGGPFMNYVTLFLMEGGMVTKLEKKCNKMGSYIRKGGVTNVGKKTADVIYG